MSLRLGVQAGEPLLFALAAADVDLAGLQVDVLGQQRESLGEPQA